MTYKLFKDGKEVNRIVADEEFVTSYCEKHGYTFELIPEPEPTVQPKEPTQLDRIEAQVTYTALKTGTLMGQQEVTKQ